MLFLSLNPPNPTHTHTHEVEFSKVPNISLLILNVLLYINSCKKKQKKTFLIHLITWPFQVKVYLENIGITKDYYTILEIIFIIRNCSLRIFLPIIPLPQKPC